MFQDTEVQLGINQCVKLESGKVFIQEPLDCLLSCVSWILLLQPDGKSVHSSDSWPCFGFSLTQENEVLVFCFNKLISPATTTCAFFLTVDAGFLQAGRTLSGESFSSALSKIRRFLRTENLEGLLESYALLSCWH